ncbi:MAG: hypothetical protein WCD76_21815 [Pyrinomonadaceae bacterium]
MSLPLTHSPELTLSEAAITPGLQCCLLCGRTLTDRALHDALEQPALDAIRAEHPEWSSVDGACQPCVDYYRELLRERMTREERASAPPVKRRPNWLAKLFSPAAGAPTA